MKTNKEIAEMFVGLREMSGLKQDEVAIDMGITQQAYSCLESGQTLPRISTIEKFCKIVKVSPVRFMIEVFNPAQGSFNWERAQELIAFGPDETVFYQ